MLLILLVILYLFDFIVFPAAEWRQELDTTNHSYNWNWATRPCSCSANWLRERQAEAVCSAPLATSLAAPWITAMLRLRSSVTEFCSSVAVAIWVFMSEIWATDSVTLWIMEPTSEVLFTVVPIN